MTFLLDTNACIRYLNGRAAGSRRWFAPLVRAAGSRRWFAPLVRAAGIVRRMMTVPPTDIAICSVVKAELFYGAMKSADPAGTLAKQNRFLDLFVSLPIDDHAAQVYGRIRADLATRGMLIGPNDLMIGAIAVANGLTLVTHNTAEFGRISSLTIVDWEAKA